jgi:hypothetical protein
MHVNKAESMQIVLFIMLCLLTICPLGVSSLVPVGRSCGGSESSKVLRLTTKIVKRRYCVFTGTAAKLRFDLTLNFENISKFPFFLDRVRIPGIVFVARTAEDIHHGRYEPGSVMLDTLGGKDPYPWKSVDRKLAPGQTLKLDATEIWILVSTHSPDVREVGAAPGPHFLQILAVAEGRDRINNSNERLNLQSKPIPFTVEREYELQGCE